MEQLKMLMMIIDVTGRKQSLGVIWHVDASSVFFLFFFFGSLVAALNGKRFTFFLSLTLFGKNFVYFHGGCRGYEHKNNNNNIKYFKMLNPLMVQ